MTRKRAQEDAERCDDAAGFAAKEESDETRTYVGNKCTRAGHGGGGGGQSAPTEELDLRLQCRLR